MDKKPTIADELIAGFTELADALDAGKDIGAEFNCYQIKLDLRPQCYTPAMVKATRKKLGASQVIFARFLGVSPKTVRAWEQGTGKPKHIACRFMDEIYRNPDYWIGRLRESVTTKRGRSLPT